MPELSKNVRLPRRYDPVLKTLRELMNSKSEKVRLAAVMRYTEILEEHRRSNERVAIATERATARRVEAEAERDESTAKREAEEAARAQQEIEEAAKREREEDMKRMVDAMLHSKVTTYDAE